MRRLLAQQNQVSYAALFSRPAFALWGEEKTLLDGLFSTFSKRGIGLANFRFGQGGQDPASRSLTVTFGSSCFYRFQLDRVDSALDNFGSEDLAVFPEILEEGASWLRSIVPQFAFQSHMFAYSGHCKLSDGTSREVLEPLPTLSIPEIGSSEGNGIIFHWTLPDQKSRVQLTIDHSLVVPSGLFTHFLLFVNTDVIDYRETVARGRGIMEKALKQIGLEFDDANGL
jgi:hypothetical protein